MDNFEPLVSLSELFDLGDSVFGLSQGSIDHIQKLLPLRHFYSYLMVEWWFQFVSLFKPEGYLINFKLN